MPWTEVPDGGLMRIVKDGNVLFTGTSNECFSWMHGHCNFSIDYEVRYNGYTIEPVPSEPEPEGEQPQ